MFAQMRSGIETAAPLPWIFVMGVAAADRDRPGVHVTIVDVPAFHTGIGRSAAGEFGHAASKRGLSGNALVSGPVVSRVFRQKVGWPA